MNEFWVQNIVHLKRRSRGFHLVTHELVRGIPELADCRVGLLHLFIQHTSASLTINENADPDVRVDFETAMNHVVPENLSYTHTSEGTDDMPAHVKASMLGAGLTIPVGRGELLLGTWQGIYLCEHRDRATERTVVLTLNGSR